MRTVTIVGASLAGVAAARALRAEGFDGRLVLLGAEEHAPYDRPPLSKDFLLGKIDDGALSLHDVAEGLQIDLRTGVAATGLTGTTVHTARGNTAAGDVTADGVVLATGAAARRLPGQGEGVYVLRTLDDARALRTVLVPGAHLAIVGAGFIGAEVASAARTLGCTVTVVEAAPVPLAPVLGPAMGAAVAALPVAHGVALHTGVGVTAVSAHRIDLADGRHVDADVVLVGIGATPQTGWLAGSGVALGDRSLAGAVLGDAGGATSVPGVVAAGDCAAWADADGVPRRAEHWTGAGEQAVIAAATLLHGRDVSGSPPAPRRPPYFWSDQFGVRIQFAGGVAPGDVVTVEAGDPADGSWLAVYRRGDGPDAPVTAVLGVSQGRLFTRRRRDIATPTSATATPQPASRQGSP